jgi:DNA-binding response OmpR family regulator
MDFSVGGGGGLQAGVRDNFVRGCDGPAQGQSTAPEPFCAGSKREPVRCSVVAIFGADRGACTWTATACRALGVAVRMGPDVWSDGGEHPFQMPALVLVHAGYADSAWIGLAQTCRTLGARRLVLIGPAFGSLEAEHALEHGFDETWPLLIERRLSLALLQKAWQTTSQLAMTDANSMVQVGPLILGSSPDRCTYHRREFTLGRDSLALLRVLLVHHPLPVSRAKLMQATEKWGRGGTQPTRALDMAILRLRHALVAAQVHEVVVATARGMGYRVDLVE